MSGQTSLGQKLAQLRTNRGLTQQQLAFNAGVSLSTISKLEEGAVTKPSARILLKITGVLKYDLDSLLSAEPLPAHLRTIPKLADGTKPVIKFVYFDVGGVLVHTESLILHHISAAVHRPYNQVKAVYYRYIGLEHRNKISIEDLKILMLLKLNVQFNSKAKAALFGDWLKFTEPNPPAHKFIAEVAAKHPIGLISNIGKGSLEVMRQRKLIPQLPYHAIIQSWEHGVAKPEPAMFEAAAKKAGVAPEHILLIDDRKENVVGARAVGWQATWFKEVQTEASIARIRRNYF